MSFNRIRATGRKIASIRNAVVMLLVGLVFIAISILIINGTPDAEYAETSAFVASIEPFGEEDHIVYVDYTVDGVPYHEQIGGYSSSWKVGKSITVEYNVDDPADVRMRGSDVIPYVVLAIGLLLTVFAVVGAVKAIRRPRDDYDEYNRIRDEEVPENVKEEIEEQSTEKKTYYFHYDKHFGHQGNVLEDEEREPVILAKMTKFRVFRPFLFTFENVRDETVDEVEVSHTVTKSVGTGSESEHGAMSLRIPIASYFKLNGKNIWDYIADLGYGFDWNFSGIMPCYTVYHHGVVVADIVTTSTDLYGDHADSANPAYKLPAPGHFRITCADCDLDAVFTICFALSRTELM